MADWPQEPNAGALQARILLAALHGLGVRRILLAPGSRSAPLVRAAVQHGGFDRTIRVDERGMAFQALGLGRATGRPAAVITTSGTAVANLLPACVEAWMDRVPLLLLCADRPPELHGVGANQTLPQAELLTPFLRGRHVLPLADVDLHPPALVALARRALDEALGDPAGPVQILCPFREPLAPDVQPGFDATALVSDGASLDAALAALTPPEAQNASWDASALRARLDDADRPLVVLGGDARPATPPPVPFVPDLRSGWRLGASTPLALPHLDHVLPALQGEAAPDLIVQVGGRLVSKRLDEGLGARGDIPQVVVDPRIDRLPPHRTAADHVRASLAPTLEAVGQATARDIPAPWRAVQDAVDRALAAALDEGTALSEAWVARWLARHMDPGHALFASNSLPVRWVQDVPPTDGPRLRVAANRGASGIDGIVSTALGWAEGCDSPGTLLVGDLAFLHDLNALGALVHASQPLTIVLLNNGGGGIFSLLPIAKHPELFTPWFETPHGLTLHPAGAPFGLRTFEATTREAFVDAWQTATRLGDPALIEVRVAMAATRREHDALAALLPRVAQDALGT